MAYPIFITLFTIHTLFGMSAREKRIIQFFAPKDLSFQLSRYQSFGGKKQTMYLFYLKTTPYKDAPPAVPPFLSCIGWKGIGSVNEYTFKQILHVTCQKDGYAAWDEYDKQKCYRFK